MTFKDRQEAGRRLAAKLQDYKDKKGVVVLGIPRGGVVTAAQVAKELRVPLDITIARKIGAPSNPEFALAAVGEKGDVFLNPDVRDNMRYTDYIQKQADEKRREIKKRLSGKSTSF